MDRLGYTSQALVLSPDEHLGDLLAWFERARARTRRRGRLELYRRTSVALRVGRPDPATTAAVLQRGTEEGLAVRLVARDGQTSFVASSGAGPSAVERVVDRVLDVAPSSPDRGAPWADGGGAPLIDSGRTDDLPTPDGLKTWVERSLEILGQAAAAVGFEPRPAGLWIEAAHTIESLAGAGGLAAARSRVRLWAMAQLRWREPSGARESLHGMAGRALSEMAPEAWRRVLPPAPGDAGGGGAIPEAPFLVFRPEAAAVLVAALVAALHGPGARSGFPVGRGWRVVDDPRAPGALLGAAFDDAGFPTRRRRLADGKSATGALGRRGCLRRPSFRDPPAPLAAGLRVAGGDEPPPGPGLLVDAVRLHPLGETWLVEVEGLALDGGRPRGPRLRGLVRAAPGELVRCCSGAVGQPRPTYRGVVTPALVFRGLRTVPLA